MSSEEVHPDNPGFESFVPASANEVIKIIMQSKATTCDLDPIPTNVLKKVSSAIAPFATSLINKSLDEGYVPPSLKYANVIPLIKKESLDPDVLKNYRPVSNLPFLSKVLERVVAKRLVQYMENNNLQYPFQSAYRKHHCVETALLRVQSDILTAIDKKQCVLLVLLDLSAAFDTIDHKILLTRLQSYLGISGQALKWFESYISDRKQCISIDQRKSSDVDLVYGVPQGSVLGPLLFSIYTAPLGNILSTANVAHHFYADDTQLYTTFTVDNTSVAINSMEATINLVKSWMLSNFLCLNDDKTEVLVIASKANHRQLSIPVIKVGSTDISPASCARNIGVKFDDLMSLKTHVTDTCKSAFYHLSNISKLRGYLSDQACERLIHAFVTSKLDINNSLYHGMNDYLTNNLQHVMNTAARILTRSPKRAHITPILEDLHWLPIRFRVEFKINLLTFKALHNQAPQYISAMIKVKEALPRSSRSDGKNILVKPNSRTKTYGDRSFYYCSPDLWNKLPLKLRLCDNIDNFKRMLKTHLFELAYPTVSLEHFFD